MCIHIYDIVKKYNSVSFQNLSSQDKKKARKHNDRLKTYNQDWPTGILKHRIKSIFNEH